MENFLIIFSILFGRSCKMIDVYNPYTCHESCETCFGPMIDENNMNCQTCKNNYFMTEDTNSCYNFIPNNYYLDNENMLRRCHTKCLSCSYGSVDDDNMNCLACIDNYKIQNGTHNCIFLQDDSDKINSYLEREYTWYFWVFIIIFLSSFVFAFVISCCCCCSNTI